MPRATLCYRFYRCRFSRKPSYHKPSQTAGKSQNRRILLTNYIYSIFNRIVVLLVVM